MGTGTSGSSSPLIFSFPFKVLLFFAPSQVRKDTWYDYYYYWGTSPIFTNYFSTSYVGYTLSPSYGNQNNVQKIKMSEDKKTIYLYGDNDTDQYNLQNLTYYFAGIGGFDQGGQTEWTLTTSQTWTVPRTGRYYMELYGGGGGARSLYSSKFSTYPRGYYTGRSSCQSYNSINLTSGQQINVIIGKGGTSRTQGEPTDGGATSFGSYTIGGGKKSYGEILNNGSNTYTVGSAIGNKRTSGTGTGSSEGSNINPNSGIYGSQYGYGGYISTTGYESNYRSLDGGPRAVYLKYLGA